MQRREFITLLGGTAAAWPLAARAQQTNLPKLGILLVGNREPFSRLFWAGLREFGYIDGQNMQVEFRSAEGKLNLLPELAAELVRLKVDVIVASETPSVQAAKRATSEIPIVMAPSGDPVGTGLIASLARPGGNVTGLSAATAELAGKSLELIREIMPTASRVAALADPTNAFTKPFLEQINLTARTIGIEIQVVMLRGTEVFDAAFAEMAAKRIDAVIVQPTLPRGPIIDLVQKHRLPAVSGNRAFAEAGGLMSYAASLADRYRNAAPYVDKILKGTKPADLPVQQPTKFELVINLKTAKALGLTIPPRILARADEVIE
jgi:putative ABC transport system substrate-binding protein